MTEHQARQQAYKIIVYKQIDLLTKILKKYNYEKQVSEIQSEIQKAFRISSQQKNRSQDS